MPEIGLSGSEGGAKITFVPTPIIEAQAFQAWVFAHKELALVRQSFRNSRLDA